MTSRLTRFDHLEKQRDERESPEERAKLERFEDEPARTPRPVEASEATVAPSAAEQRFSNDESIGQASEADVPFHRCPRCQVDESKFQDRCTICGFDLHSEEARAATAARLEELRAATPQFQQPGPPPEIAAIQKVFDEQLELLKVSQRTKSQINRRGLWVAAAVAAVLGLAIPGFWAKVFCFTLVAVFLFAQLPPAIVEFLGRGTRGRWWS